MGNILSGLTIFDTLVVMQMVDDGVPLSTIEFYAKTLPYLHHEDGIDCAYLSHRAYVSNQHAWRQMVRLGRFGYVKQLKNRKWVKTSKDVLKDPQLVYLRGIFI